MAKKIAVALSNDGRLLTDFDGFVGDDCLEEAERLRQELTKLGIKLEDVVLKRKAPQIPEVTPTYMPTAQKVKK